MRVLKCLRVEILSVTQNESSMEELYSVNIPLHLSVKRILVASLHSIHTFTPVVFSDTQFPSNLVWEIEKKDSSEVALMYIAPPDVAEVDVHDVNVVGNDASPDMISDVSESSAAETATPGMFAVMWEKVQDMSVVVDEEVVGVVEEEEELIRRSGCVSVML